MTTETKRKPRSKAAVGFNLPPNSHRIRQRVGRLRECIKKHELRISHPNVTDVAAAKSREKIDECLTEIEHYKTLAAAAIEDLKGL
jgi:hypothetical protein